MGELIILRETPKNPIKEERGEDRIGIALMSTKTFRGRIEKMEWRFHSLESEFIKSYTLASQLM